MGIIRDNIKCPEERQFRRMLSGMEKIENEKRGKKLSNEQQKDHKKQNIPFLSTQKKDLFS